MRRKPLWAGIDVGVETASVCITDNVGEILHQGVCRSRAADLRHELVRFRRPRYASVSVEAGTGTHLARGLKELGYPVQLFETRQISKFLRARRNKTDAGDALGIADAARINASALSKVHIKSVESQKLQARLTIRRHLLRQRLALYSLLCRQMELFGGRLRCRAFGEKLRPVVEAEIKRVFRRTDDALISELRFITERCVQLMIRQRDVDLDLKRIANANEVCRRFMEIPGVGPLCALAFYSAVDDPTRFKRCTDIGSYFGLAPRLRESGLTVKKARISKMGNTNVRCLLVHSAISYLVHAPQESALRAWTVGIEQRRGRGPSRIALARKLAVIMLSMWKNGSHFVPPQVDATPAGHSPDGKPRDPTESGSGKSADLQPVMEGV